jgi:16S rRNA (uracil1498-N3)-methyltransferase
MIPRLHHPEKLSSGAVASLTKDQAHYLRIVLRRDAGAAVKLFNARDGEFAASLVDIGRKDAAAAIGERLRVPFVEPDIEIYFAPVKRAAVESIVQKGTELGASAFVPVFTDRTNAERVRIDRLAAIALEAAEQCERISVPRVDEALRLEDLPSRWDGARVFYYCDEAGDDPTQEWGGPAGRAEPFAEVVRACGGAPAAILIGPEGGFSPKERARLRDLPFVKPATLGPRILRADTAAIVALALWQAAAGDLAKR